MQWSPGAAGPLLGEEERAAQPRFADDEEPSWQDLALCAETDPEAFFPEKGGSTREAKRVCRSCDVRAECLEYALENDERFGIWGGLSERERRRVSLPAGLPAAIVAEADERAGTSLERSNLKNVRRLADERRKRAEARGTEGLAALTGAVHDNNLRRETLNFIIGGLDLAAVAWVEKGMAAGHTRLGSMIVVGVVFGLPFLVVAFRGLMSRAGQKPAQRPVYSSFRPGR
jgi:WhiB family redox-sensing transcriptional regulator